MKPDPHTLDLFRDVSPEPVVARFDEAHVRAATFNARIARAVTAALKAFDGERAQVAQEMSAYLGERVTENMLNQYASQANAEHAIPAHRLIALSIVTGDARLINALLTDTGLVAVQAKYELVIKRELLRERIEKEQRELSVIDAQWKSKR